jgi:hypothetical protein
VQFVDVLVRQAHPGERRGAYTSLSDKRYDAHRYEKAESIGWRVLVDDLEGTVQRAYGGMAASIYLIDASGRVAFYAMWGQAPRLTKAIDELLAHGGVGPIARGIDARPHLGAAIVAGQGGPARGGLLSFIDLELGFPGALMLMTLGRIARPLLGPLVQRITPLSRVGPALLEKMRMDRRPADDALETHEGRNDPRRIATGSRSV